MDSDQPPSTPNTIKIQAERDETIALQSQYLRGQSDEFSGN